YLRGLPLALVIDGGFLAFHGALHPAPNADLHLEGAARVERSFEAMERGGYGVNVGFFGHTHRSVVWEMRDGRLSALEGSAITARPDARYLINPGSVGQPRDGDPRASFAIWDDGSRTARFHRVAYDVEGCLAKA